MKKALTIGTITFGFLALFSSAVQAKADFTGTWALDKGRSEGIPPDMDQSMTIKQTADSLEVITKVTRDQGEVTVPVTYVLDGKEVEYKAGRQGMDGKGKRIAKWSSDGNGFEVTEDENFTGPQEAHFHFDRKWEMQSDRRTLVIVMTVNGPNGSQTIKRTFVKK